MLADVGSRHSQWRVYSSLGNELSSSCTSWIYAVRIDPELWYQQYLFFCLMRQFHSTTLQLTLHVPAAKSAVIWIMERELVQVFIQNINGFRMSFAMRYAILLLREAKSSFHTNAPRPESGHKPQSKAMPKPHVYTYIQFPWLCCRYPSGKGCRLSKTVYVTIFCGFGMIWFNMMRHCPCCFPCTTFLKTMASHLHFCSWTWSHAASLHSKSPLYQSWHESPKIQHKQ